MERDFAADFAIIGVNNLTGRRMTLVDLGIKLRSTAEKDFNRLRESWLLSHNSIKLEIKECCRRSA